MVISRFYSNSVVIYASSLSTISRYLHIGIPHLNSSKDCEYQ